MRERSRPIVAWIIRVAGIRSKDIESDLATRVKIQKLVFLMSHFIQELKGFRFNLYIYGPYSPDLAEVYYELARNGDNAIEALASKYKPLKEIENILYNLSRLDNEILELMATAYDIYLSHRNIKLIDLDEDFLVRRTKIVKPWASTITIRNAIRKLKELHIINI